MKLTLKQEIELLLNSSMSPDSKGNKLMKLGITCSDLILKDKLMKLGHLYHYHIKGRGQRIGIPEDKKGIIPSTNSEWNVFVSRDKIDLQDYLNQYEERERDEKDFEIHKAISLLKKHGYQVTLKTK
jgi:hypothetical protein